MWGSDLQERRYNGPGPAKEEGRAPATGLIQHAATRAPKYRSAVQEALVSPESYSPSANAAEHPDPLPQTTRPMNTSRLHPALAAVADLLAQAPSEAEGFGSLTIVRADQLQTGDMLFFDCDPVTDVEYEPQPRPNNAIGRVAVRAWRGPTRWFSADERVLIIRPLDVRQTFDLSCNDCSPLHRCGRPTCTNLGDRLAARRDEYLAEAAARLFAAITSPDAPVTYIGAEPRLPEGHRFDPVNLPGAAPALDAFLARFGPGTEIGSLPTCHLRPGDLLADCAGRIHHLESPSPGPGGEDWEIAYGCGYREDAATWRTHLVIRPTNAYPSCACTDPVSDCEGVEEDLFNPDELRAVLAEAGLTLGTGATAWHDPWQRPSGSGH